MKRIFRIATADQAQHMTRQIVRAVEHGVVMQVTVQRWAKRRSVDQNARYWAILNEIAANAPPHMDGVWYAPELWAEHFKRKFLGVVPGPFGEVPRTTTKLSTVDFSAYCDQIEAWAAGEGIILDLY